MEHEEFMFHLKNICEPNSNGRETSEKIIFGLRSNNINLFMDLLSDALLSNSPPQLVSLSLVILRDSVRPRSVLPIEQIRHGWFNQEFVNTRERLKQAALNFIAVENVTVQNLAAAAIAQILLIEMKEWESVIELLANALSILTTPTQLKIGIIKTFHEIFLLPIFLPSTPLELLPVGLSTLLQTLIKYLEEKDIRYISALCILDMIRVVPSIFNNQQRIEVLLSSFYPVLPSSDIPLYRTIHDILIEISKQFYSNIQCFMEKVFDITYKGIICPNREESEISFEYWVFLCKFEKHRVDSYRITETVLPKILDVAFTILTNSIRNQTNYNPNDYNLLITYLRIFYNAFPILVLERFEPFIRENINNFNSINIDVSLKMLYSLCGKTNESEQLISEMFETLLFCVENQNIHIVIDSLKVIESSIQTTKIISQNSKTFEALISLNEIISKNENILIYYLNIIIELCLNSNSKLMKLYFNQLHNILINYYLNQNVYIKNIETKNQLFKAFISIYYKTPIDDLQPQFIESFTFFYRQLTLFLSDTIFQVTSQQQLIPIVHILIEIIRKLSWELKPFLNDLCETLFTFLRYQQALIYDEILNLFSTLCQKQKGEMLPFKDKIFNSIHVGLISQSPSIINSSSLLLCDFIKFVYSEEYEILLQEIFEILENPNEEFMNTIYPSIIKSISYIIQKKLDKFPFRFLDKYFDLVNNLLERPINENNKFNNAALFDACFSAFASFYKLKHMLNVESDMKLLNETKNFLKKFPRKCLETNSFDMFTLESLCCLLHEIGDMFGAKIAQTLNIKPIKELLEKGTKLKDADYAKKCKDTLKYIKNVH